MSIGPRGAKINIGKRGTYVTTSIPGTGIYSRIKINENNNAIRNTAYTSPKISEAEKFAKTDPKLLGGCLFVTSSVVGLVLWLITSRFYPFLIMAGFGIAIAFLPLLFAKSKNVETDTPDYNKLNNALKEVEEDVRYSKPFVEQLNSLLEEMDIAKTEEQLVSIHSQIIDLMNSKLKGRKILFNGISFDDAMKMIDEEYQNKLTSVRMTEDQINEIANNFAAIEEAKTSFEALNAYNKTKDNLKQYEGTKGFLYKGMNYAQLFESAYQVYIGKCKELN